MILEDRYTTKIPVRISRMVKIVVVALLVGMVACWTDTNHIQNPATTTTTTTASGGESSRYIFAAEAFSAAPALSRFERGSFCSSLKDRRYHRCSTKRNSNSGISRLFGSNDDDDDPSARALREKAAALRKEVEAFEASKREESDQLQREIEDQQREKNELRQRYSAVVPILKGDGTIAMERCDFPPRMTAMPGAEKNDDGGGDEDASPKLSRIIAYKAPLPLGIVLGQDEDLPVAQRPTTVDAVAAGSNGEKAGIRVGDCLRACTACQVTMEQPTWQLIAGGIGRPKTTRMMFGTDNRPFEEVMDAVASNAMDPESRDVWLVVERMDD